MLVSKLQSLVQGNRKKSKAVEASSLPKAPLHNPVQMLQAEQEILAALVFALRPAAVLEIGTCEGGSATIIVDALNRRGEGRLVCIDPSPSITPDRWSYLSARATLIQGTSPGSLAEAERVVGAKFNLALIDGDHSYKGALDDLLGCIDCVAPGGYILLHDAHYIEVAHAIATGVKKDARLIDCGLISVDVSIDHVNPSVFWGGLHLCRVRPN